MLRALARTSVVSLLSLLSVGAAAVPALADHTDPSEPLVPLEPAHTGEQAIVRGSGTFTFLRNFPAPTGAALAGSGTDHRYFRRGDRLYVSVGTLSQGDVGTVGQRIFLLEDDGKVDPRWVADHGSAACTIQNTAITGLQHDAAILGMPRRNVTPAEVASRSLAVKPELIVDTTDATGRCHDPAGGGLELIDVTGLGRKGFAPREVHLIRHAGYSHTVTVDDRRPWIAYNSASDFAGRPWIDVVNTRSCLGLAGEGLAEKRDRCRPRVYRIPFEADWSRQRGTDGRLVPGSEATCHDITSRGYRLYCAGVNATLIFDVRDLTNQRGVVRGTRLPCSRINGTRTGASVTDCGGIEASTPSNTVPSATGWRFLGSINHAGRNCSPAPVLNCNTNTVVPPDQDVAISHEADPVLGGDWMLVTDERGGGVVPGGASCVPGAENPIGHGGVHVYDIRDPGDIRYARTPTGEKAVWFGEVVVPAPVFCDVHVIEQVPNEQRFVAAYYTQGTKIVDFDVDAQGRWTFDEVASIVFPNANTWTSDVFRIDEHADGTNTYYFLASDINRGVDIFTWRGRPHPGSSPVGVNGPRARTAGADLGAAMLVASGLLTIAARSRRFRFVTSTPVRTLRRSRARSGA